MTDAPVLHQPANAATAAASAEWFAHIAAGPTRRRWTELPVQYGDPAPSPELVDARTERATPLASLWAEGPALLLFWRHFGCGCGRDRAVRLAAELPAYEAAGARVALIGQGDPERTRVYAAANGIADSVALLCDPDERAYRAYGCQECGPVEVLFDAPDEYLTCQPGAVRGLYEARTERGMPFVDNPWLLPAEFVVGQDGLIHGAYRYAFCEHWIDHRVNVGAIRYASGELRAPFMGG